MRGLNSFGLKEASALEARGGGSSSASPGGGLPSSIGSSQAALVRRVAPPSSEVQDSHPELPERTHTNA